MVNWEDVKLLTLGEHKDFDCIHNSSNGDLKNKLKAGDLILREMNTSCKKLYHAGIYIGNNDVIEFTASLNAGSMELMVSSLSDHDGLVCKVSVKSFLDKGNYRILRLKSGIPQNFKNRVEKSMDSTEKYNVLTNNCLHFALRLIGSQSCYSGIHL